MARPLSEDLRFRPLLAVEAGMSRPAAAQRFGVAAANAVRWVQACCGTGATRAKPQGGDRRSRRVEGYRDMIPIAIDLEVDITLVHWPNCSSASTTHPLRPARSGNAIDDAIPHFTSDECGNYVIASGTEPG